MAPTKSRSLAKATLLPFLPSGPDITKKKLGSHGRVHKAFRAMYQSHSQVKAARSGHSRKKYRSSKPKIVVKEEDRVLAERKGYRVYDDRPGIHPPGHREFPLLGKEDLKLSQLTVLDSTDRNPLFVYGHKPGRVPGKEFIVAKASREQCQQLLPMWGSKEPWLTMLVSEQKGKGIKRGKLKNLFFSKYVCLGYRKDPKTRGVSPYASSYRKRVTKTQRDRLQQEMQVWASSMERLGSTLIPSDDKKRFEKLVLESTGCPTYAGGCATQAAISKSYWSAVHTDKDYFYSVLTGWNHGEDVGHTLLLNSASVPPVQFFVFPSYGIAIPVRPGDCIVFNPNAPHAATCGVTEDSVIASFYVSTKTVLSNVVGGKSA